MLLKLSESLSYSAYQAKQVRNNEAAAATSKGLSLYELMELAGAGAFSLLQMCYPKAQHIVVLCGKGNNAGDGLILATLALKRAFQVTVVKVVGDEYTGDAKKAYNAFIATGGLLVDKSQIDLTKADVIIDAIFGTGLTGAVPAILMNLIEHINQLNIPIIALDIPSGICTDTGAMLGAAVNASQTITFVALKQGLLTGAAKHYCGELFIDDLTIGATFAQLVRANVSGCGEQLRRQIPARLTTAHKGDSGRVMVIAGNEYMPGAAKLSSEACLRSGAGLVSVVCHHSLHSIVMQNRPETVLIPDESNHPRFLACLQQAHSLVIGPGLGQDRWAQNLWAKVINQDKPMVVDADALQLLAKKPVCKENWILTPHPGEAAALLKTNVASIEQNRFLAAQLIVEKYGGVCVLKGAGSIICSEAATFVNVTGNPGMASAGMGDVLSGIIAALIKLSPTLHEAAAVGVHIHGLAADNCAAIHGPRGLLASDLFPHIQQLVN